MNSSSQEDAVSLSSSIPSTDNLPHQNQDLEKAVSRLWHNDNNNDNELSKQLSSFTGQDVPLDMSNLANEAVSRQLSKISKNNNNNDDLSIVTRTKSIPLNYNPELNLSSSRKFFILLFTALSGFLSPMSGVAFLPAVPDIANDFHTTGTIINVSNAVYMLFMMTSPCIFSPLSDIYGRRPVFLVCLIGYIISSILVAVSVDLAMFFVFRCIQAIFGTAFFSVGAHVIGDVWPPTERGRKVGLNVLGAQLGIAIGPILGGIIVNWANWRIIFYVLAGIGAFNFVGVFFLVPETSKDTGMKKLIRESGSSKKFIFVKFNPFRILLSFKYPNLIIAGIISSSMLYSMYNLLTPIRYVVDPRFGLTTPIYGALFYLAPGCGFVCGAYFGGKYSDYTVKKWIKIRKGRRVPEDRVRALVVALLFGMPIPILIYGWTLKFEKGGYAVPIIALFFYAFSQTISFPAINTYCVDSMPELSGDAIAGNYFARYMLAIASSASCLPAIESIGVGWTCTIGAFITLIGGGVMSLVLVKYGASLRKNALIKNGLRGKDEVFN